MILEIRFNSFLTPCSHNKIVSLKHKLSHEFQYKQYIIKEKININKNKTNLIIADGNRIMNEVSNGFQFRIQEV